jgi:cardiolipin synthase A/B
MAFNYTYLDMNHSRSFGLVTRNEQIVQEAVKLFEADTTRQPYTPAQDNFIVSPANARKELTAFIAGAQKQLLIYDGKLTDSQIIRLLQDRARAGVEVRVIGKLGKRGAGIKTVKLSGLRLHAQAIIRDGAQVFLGSQSLRKAELDVRREVGFITDDPNVVKQFLATFDADWSMSESAPQPLNQKKEAPVALAAMLKEAVKDVVKGVVVEAGVVAPELKKEMKEAVHEAVKEAVKEAVSETDPIT